MKRSPCNELEQNWSKLEQLQCLEGPTLLQLLQLLRSLLDRTTGLEQTDPPGKPTRKGMPGQSFEPAPQAGPSDPYLAGFSLAASSPAIGWAVWRSIPI
jgi:hypothetical protein